MGGIRRIMQNLRGSLTRTAERQTQLDRSSTRAEFLLDTFGRWQSSLRRKGKRISKRKILSLKFRTLSGAFHIQKKKRAELSTSRDTWHCSAPLQYVHYCYFFFLQYVHSLYLPFCPKIPPPLPPPSPKSKAQNPSCGVNFLQFFNQLRI